MIPNLQVHVRMGHLRKNSPYRCLLCNASFGNELDLQFHLSTHQKQFRCKLCEEAFHVEFLLDKHMQTHHTRVMNGSPLEPHQDSLTTLHPPSVPANHNNIQTNSTKSSKKGSNSSGAYGLGKGIKELKCDICDKGIGSEAELTSHRKQVHHISTSTSTYNSPTNSTTNNSSTNNNGNKSGQTKSGSTTNSSHNHHTLSLHCAYCNENCKSRSDLENHMKTHQIVSPGKQKCNICDEICPTATLLAEHKLTHCKVISGSVCTGCKQTITSEDQFYSHVKQHCTGNSSSTTSSTQLLPIPCIVCRQTLMSDIEIQMHAKFHTKQYESTNSPSNSNTTLSPVQCCLCLRVEEKSRVGLNGFTNSGQSYICTDCCRKSSLISPPKPSPKRQPHSSPAMSSIPPSSSPSTEPPPNMETICSSTLNMVPGLSQSPTNGRKLSQSYQCIKCQMSFGSEEEIQSHVTSHLMNEGSRHECRLCSQTHFDSPLKLQAHLIEHTFEGCSSFSCYMCSTVFTTANGLQQHMVEHGLHTRPYDCTHCHLKFFFRAELENHIVSHDEMKRSIIERYPSSSSSSSLTDYSKCLLGLPQESSSLFQRGSGGRGVSQHGSGKGSKSTSNGHSSSSKTKFTQKKRKKFFYRSDDSDEEMMESQSSSSLTPTCNNSESHSITMIKEETHEQDHLDSACVSRNNKSPDSDPNLSNEEEEEEDSKDRKKSNKSMKSRKQAKRRRQSEKGSGELKEKDDDVDETQKSSGTDDMSHLLDRRNGNDLVSQHPRNHNEETRDRDSS